MRAARDKVLVSQDSHTQSKASLVASIQKPTRPSRSKRKPWLTPSRVARFTSKCAAVLPFVMGRSPRRRKPKSTLALATASLTAFRRVKRPATRMNRDSNLRESVPSGHDDMVDALRSMYLKLLCTPERLFANRGPACVWDGGGDAHKRLRPVYEKLGMDSMTLGILRRAAGKGATEPGREAVRLGDGSLITDISLREVNLLQDCKGALPVSCEFLGRRVQLFDLKSCPELNRQFGVAEAFDAEAERYQVVLDGSGRTVRVRERNLCPATKESVLPLSVLRDIQGDNPRAVLRWLAQGGDVDARATLPGSRRGVTMLMSACTKGLERVVETLIEYGASVDLQEEPPSGGALLRAVGSARAAMQSGAIEDGSMGAHLANARRLLRAGASVNLPDEDGVTPLMLAAQVGDEGLVEMLLERGADVNLADREGATPIFDAVGCNRAGVVSKLLAAGARTDLVDCDGETPLMIAQRRGYPYRLVVRAFEHAAATSQQMRSRQPHAAATSQQVGSDQPQRDMEAEAARADAAMAEMLAAEGHSPMSNSAGGPSGGASVSKKARKRRAKKEAQRAAQQSSAAAPADEPPAATEPPSAATALAERTAAVHISDEEPPDEFMCPISQELMVDPVFATICHGRAHVREAADRAVARHEADEPQDGRGTQGRRRLSQPQHAAPDHRVA
jgi:ankyrin repeat protein